MLILKDFSDYSAAQNNIAGLVHLLKMNIFFLFPILSFEQLLNTNVAVGNILFSNLTTALIYDAVLQTISV